MDEPVRVGLTFPRSGQQLTVHVPRRWAQVAETGRLSQYTVHTERLPRSPYPPVADDSPRRQP